MTNWAQRIRDAGPVTARIEPSGGRFRPWVLSMAQANDEREVGRHITKRAAERSARRWLRRYGKWADRVLNESFVVPPSGVGEQP